MSDKIIMVSFQDICSEFCHNSLFSQDVDSKPVAFKEEIVKTSHTVRDGRMHFPYFLASFFLRLAGFIVMLILSILLYIVGSWFTSGQVAAQFLERFLYILSVNSKLAYTAGTFCLLISLYLLGSATVLGNLMFAKRDLSQLKHGERKMLSGPDMKTFKKTTSNPEMATATSGIAQK